MRCGDCSGLQELLVLATDETCEYIRDTEKAILLLMKSLGGNRRTYAPERGAQLWRIVSEMRSPPAAVQVAKRFPRRGITQKGGR